MKTSAQDSSSPAASGPAGLSTHWRVAISALIVFHLAAVFTGPWSFAPLHSRLADDVFRALRPYIEALALGNGYRFFAPEPGPSHLLHYEMQFADGSRREGTIPDLKTEWPRLLYHRHFMLSEFLNSVDAPGAPKGLAPAYAEGFARHLALANNAEKVELSLRRHRLITMEESRRGLTPSDPSFYDNIPLVTYTKDKD
jgi:hypothetical protein